MSYSFQPYVTLETDTLNRIVQINEICSENKKLNSCSTDLSKILSQKSPALFDRPFQKSYAENVQRTLIVLKRHLLYLFLMKSHGPFVK